MLAEPAFVWAVAALLTPWRSMRLSCREFFCISSRSGSISLVGVAIACWSSTSAQAVAVAGLSSAFFAADARALPRWPWFHRLRWQFPFGPCDRHRYGVCTGCRRIGAQRSAASSAGNGIAAGVYSVRSACDGGGSFIRIEVRRECSGQIPTAIGRDLDRKGLDAPNIRCESRPRRR